MHTAVMPAAGLPTDLPPVKAAGYHLLSRPKGETLLKKNTEKVEQKKVNETPAADIVSQLPEENLNELLIAMKIAFYKDFRKRGLLTDEQLAQLIAMQDKLTDTETA